MNVPIAFVGSITVIAAYVVVRLYQGRRNRRNSLQIAAQQHGWEWLGDFVPYDVPMNGLVNPKGDDIYTRNVFRGRVGDTEFYAFDCTVTFGRSGYSLSVVALHRQDLPVELPRKMKESRADGWIAASFNGMATAASTIAFIERLGETLKA